MNTLDWIIIGVIALSFLLGYQRGFVLQLISLLSLFLALLTAFLFHNSLVPLFERIIPIDFIAERTGLGDILGDSVVQYYLIKVISFAVLFTVVKIVLTVGGHFVNVLVKAPGLNMINQWFGAGLGVLQAVAIIMIVVYLMNLFLYEHLEQVLNGSLIARSIIALVATLL